MFILLLGIYSYMEGFKLKVDGIHIKNIGGIHDLQLSFNRGLNLICGINGVGKTTILECIAHSFSSRESKKIKRNAKSEKGEWSISIDGYEVTNEITTFEPMDACYRGYYHECDKKVLYIREQRPMDYEYIEGLKSDKEKDNYTYSSHLVGEDQYTTTSIKSWFVKKEAFRHQQNHTENEIYNMEVAKDIFTKLDEEVKYFKVKPNSLDILLKTSRGELQLEYLSSGFKSCLFIILGIIKEIELNFPNLKIKVSEFDGVILIDELDAHLHPSWQGKLIKILKETFQNAQIIVSTHSPHMIQEAEADEIIALGLTDHSQVVKLEVEKSRYGFKGWTVEEILEDVMGMKDTRSNKYMEMKDRFEKALREEDFSKAKESYDILLEMLHPRSPMKKIFELQLGTIGV